ncbi:MAG: flagellar biosynthetic protein FliO [Glaciecola sp.]
MTGFSLISLATLPTSVLAEGTASSVTSPGTVLSIFLSLVLVIAIIFALAYVMRRFNVAQAGGGQMRVVASMMAGSKEKIMVVQVGDEQHLLGVTSHNINHLAKLDEPLSSNSANDSHASKLNFQQKLVQAMATGISGNKNKDGSNG